MTKIALINDPEPGIWTQTATSHQIEGQLPQANGEPYPLAVKANISVRGFRRSAGCKALDQLEEEADAPIVAALRQTGAVVVGMANMHELACGITSNNASYGPTKLPGHPGRAAGGSSGGSAAAVARGDVPLALGTDTGGSVSIPASICGVVGFRPSTGRWPTSGVVGVSWTRDTPGLFATSVERIRAVDNVVMGLDHRTKALETHTKRPRLGIPHELQAALHPTTRRAFDDGLERLSSHVDFVNIDFGLVLELTSRAEMPTVLWEARRLLGEVAASVFSSDPASGFERIVKEVRSPDVRALLEAESSSPVTAHAYAKAQAETVRARLLYAEMFAEQSLDALLFPATPAPAPPLGQDSTVEHLGRQVDIFPLYTRNTGQGTMLGAPMVTIPAPVRSGELPVGLTIQGSRFEDRRLLALAESLEAALTPVRTGV